MTGPTRLLMLAALAAPAPSGEPRGFSIPLVDLDGETHRRTVVDREPGQYLGHPTTVLLEDNRTMICVYPKGHGRGAIVMKRSGDGGKTWSDRLPVPDNWATSKETPTIHRVIDSAGVRRLILFSGLYPIRMSVSADDGRFLENAGERTAFKVYKTVSKDGGLTWSAPEAIAEHPSAHLCEPGLVRSPDGRQLAALLRENSRKRNSFVIFSGDEGRSWSQPKELPGALTGDRHTAKYAPDGRLFITFRDMAHDSPTRGDWAGWVGAYDDIVRGREGQYRVRLMDNRKGADCCYAGLELLPGGTFVATTYGHWDEGEQPYIVSVRFNLSELDRKVEALRRAAPGRK